MKRFAVSEAHLRRRARGVSDRLRPWLPPIHRREFWAVQALVVAIAGGHDLVETVGRPAEPPALYLLPTSLFFVPVVYAALNFGLRGSLATAVWTTFLTLPNIVFWHTGLERVGVIWQLVIVLAVAAFVGQRVDRETLARREVEEREQERRQSEERYRRLFDTTADPILLLDEAGAVKEANAAAGVLFGFSAEDLRGTSIETLAGPEVAAMLRGMLPIRAVPLPVPRGTPARWVEPACAQFIEAGGAARTQLILRDVTAQLAHQEGLEALARHTLAAREEERRRIARELHDGPVQSLVLLWRRLDAVASDADPADRRAIAEAHGLAEQIADDLRRFSRDLRPSLLDDLGLGPALKAEVAALAQRSGLAGRYMQTGRDRRLAGETELMLLRIAQEALHNVERHAEARRVLIRLGYGQAEVRLSISDDGNGMHPEPAAFELLSQGKLGIVGMRERARLAGGEMHIRGGPRRGTTLSVRVPSA